MLSPNLFLPYVLLAVIVTAVAAWRARTPKRRAWTAVGLLVFFFAIAHIDDILGGIEHKWLCHKEAGFWVYKPVTLPRELYDAAGKPKFMTAHGPDEKMLIPYIKFNYKLVRDYRQWFLKIDKRTYVANDARTGETIAENVTFFSWPSEFIPRISKHRAAPCFRGAEENEHWRRWYGQLFRPR